MARLNAGLAFLLMLFSVYCLLGQAFLVYTVSFALCSYALVMALVMSLGRDFSIRYARSVKPEGNIFYRFSQVVRWDTFLVVVASLLFMHWLNQKVHIFSTFLGVAFIVLPVINIIMVIAGCLRRYRNIST